MEAPAGKLKISNVQKSKQAIVAAMIFLFMLPPPNVSSAKQEASR